MFIHGLIFTYKPMFLLLVSHKVISENTEQVVVSFVDVDVVLFLNLVGTSGKRPVSLKSPSAAQCAFKITSHGALLGTNTFSFYFNVTGSFSFLIDGLCS